jgi:uncharacterized membrane protein YdjX (TVP38/TMEM64 family)
MRRARIAAVASVAILLAAAHRSGVLERFADPADAARAVRELGAWGYVAFVLAYALLQPFGIPGTVFLVAAALIWPWPVAFALSMTGSMAATVVGFSFARFVARDWLAPKIPARFAKYEDALAARGFKTVFLLRLVFWMQPLLHAFFGVSKVPFRAHFWGSFAGYLVPVFLVSYFGEQLFTTLRNAPAAVWIGIVFAALVVATATWHRSRRAPTCGTR